MVCQRKGIRYGWGDARRTFVFVAEVCRVLPDPGFVSDVEVVVVVVCSVNVISGIYCAGLGWWYDLGGKSKGVANRDRNSCKWSHVIYWHLSCSDNYSLI
jgi:hypothetical protein